MQYFLQIRNKMDSDSNINLLIICLIVSAIIVAIAIIFSIVRNKRIRQKKRELHAQRERMMLRAETEARDSYERKLADLSAKYGECTMNAYTGDSYSDTEPYNLSLRFLIYEQAGIVVMKSKEYKFSEILDYSLVDDASNETVTTVGTESRPTDDLFKRAIVGSMIGGKMGALAGALTTKTETSHTSHTTTSHDYKIYVNTDSLRQPVVTLHCGSDVTTARQIAGALNIIVERNNRTR